MKKERMYLHESIHKQITNLTKTILTKLHPDKRLFIPLAKTEIANRTGNTPGAWKKDDDVSKSTKINEQTILRHIIKCKGDAIRCCDITPRFIHDLQDYLDNLRNKKGEKLKDSTKATYMSSARSLLNRMGFDGDSLFDGINTRIHQTDKRAISEDDIQKIKDLAPNLASGSFLYYSLMLFLFCFSANGMPFIDLAFLKWEMITDDTITYYRHKTGVRVEVPINDFMRSIMEKISKRESFYVFGLLESLDPDQALKEYHNLLTRYNRALHLLGEKAGLSAKLTSYVARHSWATITYLRNYPIAFISKALGHTSILTTEKYIKSISNKELIRFSKEVARIINLNIIFDKQSQKEVI